MQKGNAGNRKFLEAGSGALKSHLGISEGIRIANPLDELPYQYFSSTIEEVSIRVSLTIRYSYK